MGTEGPGATNDPHGDAVKVGEPYAADEIGRTIRRLIGPGLEVEDLAAEGATMADRAHPAKLAPVPGVWSE